MNKNKRKMNKKLVVALVRILSVPEVVTLDRGVPTGNLYRCPMTDAILWVSPSGELGYCSSDKYLSLGHDHWYGDSNMRLVACNVHNVEILKVVLNELI
ncbi:MAG: hypothetical protein [Caudoviricetes sp.]|nr:MAG: hypothetical protein [Caudoviricetes sp.]